MSSPLPITVCIPVRNEEKNLPFCLNALGDSFTEIVVIDSGSTDRTRDIAEIAGVKVMDFAWDGKFPKKRNWALRNYSFSTPWVLFLDGDEGVTPAFIEELRRVIPQSPHAGYWISFENWFMGHPLRHGDVFRKLALFRVGTGEYERFPEDFWSHLDMEVHEHPVLEGTTGEIVARLEHHDFRGLKHYIAKHNEYSTWEANRYRWLQGAGQNEWAKLNDRQRFKYRNLDKWWLGWVYWGVAYFLKKGFLDGSTGWTFNRLKRRYFDEIRLKILESKN
ncbi:glycosyltransferase family 2 protein [Luteolibacter flavescens]|uniref:Glycosyltransferase family 2 protein n=1 Tax=Luteolibacter flavescens TaxID=1859460 RepID=A0ABT3FVH7_9BACT|nr:glycosyltransferase family 2 protein [Luteolibacter flavescens]MCW1887324.1 glycosyltransferase family 2 protein [Luteolibacter flavescens]